MTSRTCRYLPLVLILLLLFPAAPAVAQGSPPETFLPSIGGYVEPPVLQPSPYDIEARDLVIGASDLARVNNYDYEVTQDEPIQLSDAMRSNGAVNGYITYLINEEEDIRKGPFALGSYAIVFMNEEQTKAYFEAVKQSYIDDGFERFDYDYDDSGLPDPFVVYGLRETVQGYHFTDTYTLAYEGNVFVSTYVFDLEERDSTVYAVWMLDEFAPDRGDPFTAQTMPADMPTLEKDRPSQFGPLQ